MSNSDIKRNNSNRRKSKKKKRRDTTKVLKIILVVLVLMFAAVLGASVAKFVVTPKSSDILELLDPGTLDDVEISKEKCNVLIMGTDKEGLRTDVMMIAQIDPVRGTATVMSIPRDTKVKYNNRTCKINEVPVYSRKKGEAQMIQDSIECVKSITGIPIHHFVKFNFKAFNDCIDELGGVEFYVPQNMYYTDPAQDLYINLKKGKQVLDGNKAEQLVRFRRYPQGDLARIKVQQDFIHAVVDQKLQIKYIGRIDEIYEILSNNMETSMSPDDMAQCAKQLLEIGTGNIETITMPGTPKDIGGGSYIVVNYDELMKVREQSFGYDAKGKEIRTKK